MDKKILRDRLFMGDKIAGSHPQTLWAKTKVMVGYGLHKNRMGLSELDETIFETENIVPIGGVQYAMEQIFGVSGPITIPVLNDTMGIGAQNTTVAPLGGMPYAYGQSVCLFGVGTGGSAENNLTVKESLYNEFTVPDMIPFRYTNEPLSDSDEKKYFGKKTVDGITAYYLKRFDTDPVIHHYYKNGEDGEYGAEVTSSIYSTSMETGITSLTECCLTINKKDIREWFTVNGGIEESRVNSVGLFTAVYDSIQKDYAQIQLFSKLNIPTEPMSLTKDMNIIYIVYGA